MADPTPSRPTSPEAQELLWLRCRRGDRTAWEELVATWERPLFYYVRQMTRSEERALQALQETWVQVFTSLGSLTDPARLAPWLYTIARRTAFRSLGRQRDEPVESAQADPLVPDLAESEHDAEAVHLGLSKIAAPLREVLTLFFLEDLSIAEIAQVLGIPAGTVKSRLHTARASLRRVLVSHVQDE